MANVSTTARKIGYKGIKIGSFASDAGKVAVTVSKGEVAFALGIEGSKESPSGLGLKAVATAVSQPKQVVVDGVKSRVDERLAGVEGLRSLHDDFGNGTLRALWLDETVMSKLAGDEAVTGAFVALQVESDRRQEAGALRFNRLVEASKAKKAAKTGAEAEGEKIAA